VIRARKGSNSSTIMLRSCLHWYQGWKSQRYQLRWELFCTLLADRCTECGSTADLSHEICGSHHRRSCLPSLAARPGADRLQGRCADVQSFSQVRRGIWDHWFLLPICPADGHYALVAPIVCCAIYQTQTFNSRWPGHGGIREHFLSLRRLTATNILF